MRTTQPCVRSITGETNKIPLISQQHRFISQCVPLFSYVFHSQPNDCSDQQLYSRPTLTESRSQSTVFTFNAYFQFVPTITVLLRGINVFRCTPNISLLLTTFTPHMHVELGVHSMQCLVTLIGCGSNS